MGLISQETMKRILEFAYEKAINGIPGIFDSAFDLAKDYKTKYQNNLEKQVDSFINRQCTTSAISGASTGLGGFLTMSFTLPTNITTVLAIQIRMIATIAILCGYDVNNDKVKALIFCCLVKQSIEDIIKETIGIKIAEKFSVKLIQRMPYDLIKIINKKVGVKLITKFGQKGVINLGKLVPVVGVFLGATIDWYSTKVVGIFTKKALMSEEMKNNFIEAEIAEEK